MFHVEHSKHNQKISSFIITKNRPPLIYLWQHTIVPRGTIHYIKIAYLEYLQTFLLFLPLISHLIAYYECSTWNILIIIYYFTTYTISKIISFVSYLSKITHNQQRPHSCCKQIVPRGTFCHIKKTAPRITAFSLYVFLFSWQYQHNLIMFHVEHYKHDKKDSRIFLKNITQYQPADCKIQMFHVEHFIT